MERYIYAVTRYMPEKMKEEVNRELQANILDMLPENPTEMEMTQVLATMGEPQSLARKYYPKDRYLIGPQFYDRYLSLLILILPIVGSVLLGLSILSLFLGTGFDWNWLGTSLQSVISGTLQAALWITVFFAVAERHGLKVEEKWLEKLPKVPKTNGKAARAESIFEVILEIILTVGFLAVIAFFPQYLTFNFSEGVNGGGFIFFGGLNADMSIPIFDLAVLQRALPIIATFAILNLALSFWRLVIKAWNLKLAIFNGVVNVAGMLFFLYLITAGGVFNPQLAENPALRAFFDSLETGFQFDLALDFLLNLTKIAIFGGAMIDTVVGFYRALKNN